MRRREFVSTPLVTAAMQASSALAQETPRYDTVLKGGHVIDPANEIDGVRVIYYVTALGSITIVAYVEA